MKKTEQVLPAYTPPVLDTLKEVVKFQTEGARQFGPGFEITYHPNGALLVKQAIKMSDTLEVFDLIDIVTFAAGQWKQINHHPDRSFEVVLA